MKTIFYVFLIIILGFSKSAFASHVIGSDLGFKSLGGSKYRIILKLYRDCRGDSFRFTADSTAWFAGNNGNQNTSLAKLKLTRISIQDISPRCSTSGSPCNPANTIGTGEGVEEHIYAADIDLNAAPFNSAGLGTTNCEFTVVFFQCCRNGAITTGPAGDNFFTRSTLNICNLNKCKKKVNSTVQCQISPIYRVCCNLAQYLNPYAIDTVDFDSVSFRSVSPLKGISTPVVYAAPFEQRFPLTPYCVPPTTIKCAPNITTNPPRGYFFDSVNGNIIFTPTKCDEVTVSSMEILDYRKDTLGKYVLIGKVRREMQIVVKNDCGYNNAPTISGPTTNKVCEGDKICFDIDGKDATFTPYQTVPDTVQLRWNSAIPGATFKIKNPKDREKTAEFCWQTKLGQASDVAYSFTVTATDDHCPKPATAIGGFKILVMPRALDTRRYRCLNDSFIEVKASTPGNFNGTPLLKWSMRDSNGNNQFAFSNRQIDTFRINQWVRYIMVHTINNSSNCPTIYRDTLICKMFGLGVPKIAKINTLFFPNPVHRGETISLNTACETAEFIDFTGKIIFSGDIKNNQLNIPSKIYPGIYQIRICGENILQGKLMILE